MNYNYKCQANRIATWVLRGPLTAILFGIALLHLECWLLSCLAWPWSPDHDVFATLARSWDAGVLPYRDMEANNPPVTIYLYWALGKAFGWGRTTPFFAFDAVLTASLGIVMMVWSRRRFETMLPAAVGYLWFLRYYLGLDYSMAGQRDWHASLLATAAIMAAESCFGRRGRWISAAAAAGAVAIRPQCLLFLPVLILIVGSERRRLEPPTAMGAFRTLLEWAGVFALVLALAFAPLVAAGVLGDFAHDFRRAAYGGRRNPLTVWIFFERILTVLWRWEFLAILGASIVSTFQTRSPFRWGGAAWISALLATVLYKAISPRQHNYLDIPLFLLLAVNLSIVVGMVLRSRETPAALRLAAVSLALGVNAHASLYTGQHHVNMQWSFASVEEIWYGREPIVYPNGYSGDYPLRDYEALLKHLRTKTDPQVSLANALAYPLALTGPTARLSAFPAESLAWLMEARPDDEDVFVDKLERTQNSVVIWIPSEFRRSRIAQFKRIEQAIRRLYEPDARVGPFEIWRRTM